MSNRALPADVAAAAARLVEDMRAIFGARLGSLVAYGPRLFGQTATATGARVPINALALVETHDFRDLTACAERADGWSRAGLAMPLLLSRHEFHRSLDVFPFEYGDIIAHHFVLHGADPFDNVEVKSEDLRRAVEAQAKSHLIHLREGYLETCGRATDVANLILASASPFAVLLGHLARLRGVPDDSADRVLNAVAGIDGAHPGTIRHVVNLVSTPVARQRRGDAPLSRLSRCRRTGRRLRRCLEVVATCGRPSCLPCAWPLRRDASSPRC